MLKRICPSFKLVNRRKSVNFTRWVSGFFQKHRTILRPSKLIVVAPFESSHFFKKDSHLSGQALVDI